MFSKLNLYLIALCAFLITAPIWAQSIQDSTDLTKMRESDFKAMEPEGSMTVLTKGNMKKTFKGMQVMVDNSGGYIGYHRDLVYTVVERSGNLAIQRYTPRRNCSSFHIKKGRDLCIEDDRKLGGRSSIMCVIPQGAKSCTGPLQGYYELTLSGLLMGESIVACWHKFVPMVNYQTVCGHNVMDRKVYLWNTRVAAQ